MNATALTTTATSPERERLCTLVEWRPWQATGPSALIGHATISFSGWTIHRIPIFSRDGTLSAGSPSAPELDRAGRAKVKADGKREYTAIITFDSAEARERWNRTVVTALAQAGIGGEVAR